MTLVSDLCNFFLKTLSSRFQCTSVSPLDILEGYNDVERSNRPLAAQLDALADMKFTYVVSCQMFGAQKSAGDPHAQDILDLMIK